MDKKLSQVQQQAANDFAPNWLVYSPLSPAAPFNHISSKLPQHSGTKPEDIAEAVKDNLLDSHIQIIGPGSKPSYYNDSAVQTFKPQDAIFLNLPSLGNKSYEGTSIAEERLGTELSTTKDMQHVANAILIVQKLQEMNAEKGADAPKVFLFRNDGIDEKIAQIISEHTEQTVNLFDDTRLVFEKNQQIKSLRALTNRSTEINAAQPEGKTAPLELKYIQRFS